MKTKAETYSSPEHDRITTPDFDSEVTMLSARPVVPLAEVGSKSCPWLWFLSGAFAIVLATVAIAFLMQVRHRPDQAPQTPVANSASTVSETTAGGRLPVEEPQPESEPNPMQPQSRESVGSESVGSEIESKSTRSRSKTSVLARVAKQGPNVPEDPLKTTVLSGAPKAKINTPDVAVPGPIRAPVPRPSEPALEEEALRQTRARRVRAHQRQERERNRVTVDDDIFRIEEIFRGSPRP